MSVGPIDEELPLIVLVEEQHLLLTTRDFPHDDADWVDELSATLASLDTDHQDLIVGLGVDHVGANECLHEIAAIIRVAIKIWICRVDPLQFVGHIAFGQEGLLAEEIDRDTSILLDKLSSLSMSVCLWWHEAHDLLCICEELIYINNKKYI